MKKQAQTLALFNKILEEEQKQFIEISRKNSLFLVKRIGKSEKRFTMIVYVIFRAHRT